MRSSCQSRPACAGVGHQRARGASYCGPHAHEAVVRAKQRAVGVSPSQRVNDDLSRRVGTGLSGIRETQDKDAGRIVTESRKRQADYYSGTSEASSKVWTNAAGDVSDDAKKVIEDVAGVNRGEPDRPIKAPRAASNTVETDNSPNSTRSK